MAALTDAQKQAFAREILEILKNNKEKLQSAGFDVSAKINSLEANTQEAEKQKAEQRTLEAKKEEQTKKARETLEKVYDEASADVELVVGILGKDDDLSHQLKKIRDSYAKESLRGKEEEEKKPT